jgi:ADP-ribose pyrophosphatase YjhB (NUDIX family)
MDYINQLRSKTENMPLILTGAAGAIIKDRKILLVLHKQKNQWQIPGGLQEFGESLEKTIEREIKEELNLDLVADSLITLLSDIKWGWNYPNGFKIHPVTAFYRMIGKIEVEKIKIQKTEILDYRFFDLDNIPIETFECCKEKIKILKEIGNIKES